MQIRKDNYLDYEENSCFKAAMFSTVGGRANQQDSAGLTVNDGDGLFVVCDGMGGHKGGKAASSAAVDRLLATNVLGIPEEQINTVLLEGLRKADSDVASFRDEDGSPLNCGTTAAVVVIRNKRLYWISAGDSRIYIYRNGEFVQITNDHIYAVALRENMRAGQITKEYFDDHSVNADALISFVGMNGMPLVDRSVHPVGLRKDDVVLIMTDGLYKNLPDSMIKKYIENFVDPSDFLRALEQKVNKLTSEDKTVRDNMTVVLIRIK